MSREGVVGAGAGGSGEGEEVVVVGRERPYTYVLNIIVRMNQGAERITILGKSDNISKAVAVYNMLKDRLGDALELRSVNIGSSYTRRNRRVSYIEIRVSRRV